MTGKETTPRILVVDDTPVTLDILVQMLVHSGYDVRSAEGGQAALVEVNANPPDLILMDVRMPTVDGYQVARLLKSKEDTKNIPIIFLSALDEIEDKMKAFQAGGVDYITKPAQVEEVVMRVQNQLALAAQRRRIEELSSLKDDLISVVSHDLKNPLQLILGYSDLLLDREGPPLSREEAFEAIRKVRENADYMMSIVFDLLDLKKIEDGLPLERSAVSLHELLTHELEMFRLLADRASIRLSLSLPDEDVQFSVDETRLRQVIHNLMSNAIKYTSAGGDVLISAVSADGKVTVQIADTGVGIPAKDLPHVFEKFYRVKGSQHMDEKGSGLGLAVAKSIIEQHGGAIWVNSQEGRGSTFCFSVPLP